MNKRDFLSQLSEALSYELPQQMVDANLRYYSSYIEEEANKGRSYDEVLSELGDPRLIARSIVDAAKSGADGVPGTDDDITFSGSPRQSGASSYDTGAEPNDAEERSAYTRRYGSSYSYGENGSSQETGNRDGGGQGDFRTYTYQTGCLGALLFVFAAGLVLSLLGTVIGGTLSLLSPVLGPICLVALIFWLLKKINDNR